MIRFNSNNFNVLGYELIAIKPCFVSAFHGPMVIEVALVSVKLDPSSIIQTFFPT